MNQRIIKEISHYRTLSSVARQLLFSSVIYELAYPILFTFLSAFLFRSTGGFLASTLFNIGLMIGIPSGFYINGLLLKRWSMKWLLLIGLVGQGLVASSAFFLHSIDMVTIFMVGLLQGLPMGLYFGNRNFVTLDATQDEHRSYYTGLEQIVGNVAGVVSPLITGWALVFGERWSSLSLQNIYQLLAIVATVGLLMAGRLLFESTITNPPFKKLWLGALHSPWNKGRFREVLFGMENGLKIVLPPLLVLFAVGKEGALGTVLSLAAVVSSTVLYVLARKMKVHNRVLVLKLVIIANIAVALLMALVFHVSTVLLFLLIMPTLHQIFWLAFHPMQLQVIDQEEGGDATNNYAYVADRELFLNIGRIMAIVLFFGLFSLLDNETALRLTPLLVAVFQVGVLLAI